MICVCTCEDTAKQLVTAFVLSRFDCCNSLLMGTPHSITQPIQKVQNTSALLILNQAIKTAHLSYSSSTGSQFLNE